MNVCQLPKFFSQAVSVMSCKLHAGIVVSYWVPSSNMVCWAAGWCLGEEDEGQRGTETAFGVRAAAADNIGTAGSRYCLRVTHAKAAGRSSAGCHSWCLHGPRGHHTATTACMPSHDPRKGRRQAEIVRCVRRRKGRAVGPPRNRSIRANMRNRRAEASSCHREEEEEEEKEKIGPACNRVPLESG